MSFEYYIPNDTYESKIEIKKSKFTAVIKSVNTVDHAKEFLSQVKQFYPNANHYCWAYKLGSPNDDTMFGFSDDGEPTGTAGKPILAHLQAMTSLGEVMVVVVRYFGGVRLGKGGLIRAYGGIARTALSLAQTEKRVHYNMYRLELTYANFSQVQYINQTFDVKVVNVEYLDYIYPIIAVPIMNESKYLMAIHSYYNACEIV